MKIVFICGCLEDGRDGVGDYTLRLACEILNMGHSVNILAVDDKYVTQKMAESKYAYQKTVAVLHLPHIWPLKQRFLEAQKKIGEILPDWISLQFVIFSFNKKGLPFGLSKRFAALAPYSNWHIMFHETWVRRQSYFDIKHYLWGQIQRQLIIYLIKSLKPKVVHTNTHLYQSELRNLGFNAQYLPLFSNIPNFNKRERLKFNVNSLRKKISFIVFGQLHPNVPIQDFVNDVSDYSIKNDIMASLIILGRCGDEMGNWVSKWKAANMSVKVWGEQPLNKVAEIFETADIGISTMNISLIEKSGSVAAMLEHGLPVISVSKRWQVTKWVNIKPPMGVFVYRRRNLDSILSGELSFKISNNISFVAKAFIGALSKSS